MVATTKHQFAETLSSRQRAKLVSMAHSLKPLVQIGAQGFSENVCQEITSTLEKHELIKVQLPSNSDSTTKQQETEDLIQRLPKHSHLVKRIGRIVILYLEKNPKEAKIQLSSQEFQS